MSSNFKYLYSPHTKDKYVYKKVYEIKIQHVPKFKYNLIVTHQHSIKYIFRTENTSTQKGGQYHFTISMS